ncbi:MAG: Smr/MutS family protein [Balneolaceae bacterium]
MATGNESGEPHRLPIDGILDLHTFRPSDLGTLIDDYIEACLEKGIKEVRIIHGKGTGTLRRSVHHLLERNPHVESFGTPSDSSGWGATVATLRPKYSKQ